MLLLRLLHHLVEVERGGVVVPLECRIDLVQYSFALKEDGTAHARNYIINLSERVRTLGKQSKRSHLGGGHFPHFVEVVVQEDYQGQLTQLASLNLVV